jgi:hypothetical protein
MIKQYLRVTLPSHNGGLPNLGQNEILSYNSRPSKSLERHWGFHSGRWPQHCCRHPPQKYLRIFRNPLVPKNGQKWSPRDIAPPYVSRFDFDTASPFEIHKLNPIDGNCITPGVTKSVGSSKTAPLSISSHITPFSHIFYGPSGHSGTLYPTQTGLAKNHFLERFHYINDITPTRLRIRPIPDRHKHNSLLDGP